MAAVSVFVMNLDKATFEGQTSPMQIHFNEGFELDVTFEELAKAVAKVAGYQASNSLDLSMLHCPSKK